MKASPFMTMLLVTFVLCGPSLPGATAQISPNPNRTEPTQQLTDSEQVPKYLKYLLYFRHLAALDQLAARKEADGKDGTGWRTHEQRAIGLTETEGKILKEVAFECNRAVKEIDERTLAAVQFVRAQGPESQANVLEDAKVVQLRRERVEIISSTITDLQVKLGAVAFDKLDRYIRNDSPVAAAPLQPKSRKLTTKPDGAQ